MQPEKKYCPYCGLRLDKSGIGHKSESEAWNVYSCDYDSRKSTKSPVLERDRIDSCIKIQNKNRNKANKLLRELKARKQELLAADHGI